MAKQTQIKRSLDAVVGNKLAISGIEPPRLVRANSAFSKRKEGGNGRVVEV